MMRPLTITLLLGAWAPALAQDCADLRGPEVRELVAALDSAAAIGPRWADYTIASHPVALLSQARDTTVPACAAIWRHGKPLEIVPTSRGMRMSTPLYALWNGDSITVPRDSGNAGIAAVLRGIPRELEQRLRASGDTRALVLPAPLRFERMGAFGRAMQTMGVKPTPLLAQLAIHESYHLHSQIPSWLGQRRRYAWPAWDVQPDRKTLVAQCYGATPAVAALHQRELAALDSAWSMLMAADDSAVRRQALGYARSFVSLRRERQSQLAPVAIPSPAGPMSCARAEDVMELEEGAPRWMELTTTLRAGIIGVADVGRASDEPFYISGSLQLWVLERLYGAEAMRILTHALVRSRSPEGDDGAIHDRFARLVLGSRDDDTAADSANRPRDVRVPTTNGTPLPAQLHGSGPHGVVVLAHGGYSTLASWAPQARALAAAGYRVLVVRARAALDLEAGRETPCLYDAACLAKDVLAGVRFLRDSGAMRVALLGGSMGGAAVAQASTEARRGDVGAIVLLSPAIIDAPQRITARTLVVATRDDANASGPRLPGIRSLFERARGPKRFVLLEGAAHAQRIFGTAAGDEVLREIVRFLAAP